MLANVAASPHFLTWWRNRLHRRRISRFAPLILMKRGWLCRMRGGSIYVTITNPPSNVCAFLSYSESHSCLLLIFLHFLRSSFFYIIIIILCFSKVPAYLQVLDIAGLVKGASEGQGLGNAFLSHIKQCDAIFHMSRKFSTFILYEGVVISSVLFQCEIELKSTHSSYFAFHWM